MVITVLLTIKFQNAWKKIKVASYSFMIMLIIALMMACTRLGVLVHLLVIFFATNNNDHFHQSELVSLLLILSQVVHILEYLGLIYGLSRFLKYIYKRLNPQSSNNNTTNNESNGGHDVEVPRINVENFKKKANECFETIILPSCNYSKSYPYYITVYTIVFLAGAFHVVLSFTPPVLHMVWRNEIVISYNYSRPSGDTAATLAFFSHFFNFCVRVAMIAVTIAIQILWDRERHHPNTITDFDNDYKKTGKFVASLQGIFQEWFVLKWIVYFLNIVGDITLSIKVLFSGNSLLLHQGHEEMHVFLFVTLHLVYDFVAFTTIFICGALMNSYHRKYYRKSQKAIWNPTNGIINMTPENIKYKFTPSFCGLKVPLNNAGYLITFALAIVGFITSILITFVEV